MIHDNSIHIIGHELNLSPKRQTDTPTRVALTVSLHEFECATTLVPRHPYIK